MLIEFNIENYLSLKEGFSFSLVASKSDHSLEKNLILGEKAINMDGGITRNSLGKGNNLLRSAAIYGANASGKSNSLKALGYLKHIITNSIKTMPGDQIPFYPFKLDKKCLNKPCKFNIEFIYEGIRYNYGASFTAKKVINEYLYYYPKGSISTIFERVNTKDYSFTVDKVKQNRIASDTNENVFYLASSSQRNYDKTIKAFKWFKETLAVIVSPKEISIGFTAELVSKNEVLKQNIKKALIYADLGIIDFESKVEEVPYEELPEELKKIIDISEKKLDSLNHLDLQIFHKGFDEEHHDITIPFEFSEESDGTQKMFSLMGPWIDALKKGIVLVIDELDCELHPLLCEYLIQMFNSPESNTSNAQLIFSAHNTFLINSELLRRDQIWFTEKNIDTGNTEIYSLLEIKQRQGVNFEKGYLKGKYGAIPYLKGFRDVFV
ncbi:hypothetical protein MSSAC_1509 [Methanosarcina siciliae C2J]|uniref:ATPase AAA-type core domain-containing protein n=2 Tax=Methanosarcina siciliae TaxID=38027 RepID=A0A0E3P431_9EURY|nr:ATP-binding protein [Methanosarcina siciliae]AKB28224.1 hypothetical protein MSSIT_1505 [Methanosarcina siciliae T4/M]AKB36099.1 hypothetical protein MSSAC_1509 [Methanosarcina siciliae C2J]